MAQSTFGYANITANGTTTLKSGAGTLHRVTINGPGATWTLTLFDSVTGAGTKIGTITVAAGQPFVYDVNFVNGLTVVAAGTTPGDVTVAFN